MLEPTIVPGLRDSVDEFQRSVPGTTAKDVMNLVLMTQYFDALKKIRASSRTNAILIPHSPGNLSNQTGEVDRDRDRTDTETGSGRG